MGRPDTADPQFRILQGVHETFAGSLATSLATFLQSEILASLREICFVTAADFQSALPAPSCLIALRLHPRQERTILYFPSPTVFALLDLLLGGKGGPGPTPERGLTEIEWSLLEEVVRVIVRCLGEAWQCFHAVEFEVESLGSDPSLLPSPDPTRSVVRIGFDLQLGGQAASFDIVVPRIFFETAGPGQEQEEDPTSAAPAAKLERNLDLLKQAVVELEVTLQGPTLTFGKLKELKAGQVVTFDYSLNKPLTALVNGSVAITGHIVSAGRKRAFQVEELP
jgi:flagellar motor switch protein FliM